MNHPRRPSESSLNDIPLPAHPGLSSEVADWTQICARDLIAQQTVIALDADTPIEKACETLIINGISSAPVYDRNLKCYTGMFDYSDMLMYLLLVLRRERVADEKDYAALIGKAARAESISVKLASDLSKKNPFYSVLPETSLLQVAEIFGSGTHRVAVMDGAGQLMGILTQSNLIRFFGDRMFQFPGLVDILGNTLEQVEMGTRHVISVDMEETVLDALAKLCQESISSVAVVDHHNVLFGNISVSDIKHVMRHQKQSLLFAPCHKFVAHVKMEQGAQTGQDTVPVFDIHPNGTLRLALRKLAAIHTHRLWVTDQQGHVTGFVSLTDMIRTIVKMTEQ